MKKNEQYILDVMSGRDRSATAVFLRGAMRGLELLYAPIMAARNRLFDHGVLKSHTARIATISVGNITAGGTGKTPFVLWLARRLLESGSKPGIVTRGYRKADGVADEAQMLRSELGDRAAVIVNPDRVAGATEAMRAGAQVLVLDDAFQHRRMKRDLDIVLINALEPWGYGHVHPRGLLREPVAGLARAQAIIITHAGEVPPHRLTEIETRVRRHNLNCSVYHASHQIEGLRSRSASQLHPLDLLKSKRFFAVAGVGYPQSVDASLSTMGSTYVGHEWFGDHHAYTEEDASHIYAVAKAAGAEFLVTTEKDWTKLAARATYADLPVLRLSLKLGFAEDHERLLVKQIEQAMWVKSRAM